jgi:PiT family inorganic phosphate transporter
VIIGLLFSTFLGFGGAFIFAKILRYFFASSSPLLCRKNFGRLQILSSSFMAFSHGSNDGQKFIGVFSLTLLLGGVYTTFTVPFWVILLCAGVMGIGTSVGGYRIIRTMGTRMAPLDVYQGFAAETIAASAIEIASRFGVPVSTTHMINTSIMGVGVASRATSIRWPVVKEIVTAWILTFPVCGVISYLVTICLRAIL